MFSPALQCRDTAPTQHKGGAGLNPPMFSPAFQCRDKRSNKIKARRV